MAEIDFDKWNVIKKELDSPQITHKKVIEGCVYWVKIGRNVGSEIYGKGSDYRRPVLVVKVYKTRKNICLSFLGIPISTKIKFKDDTYCFEYKNEKRILTFSQVRVFGTKRVISRFYKIKQEQFNEIKEKFVEFISPSTKLGNP